MEIKKKVVILTKDGKIKEFISAFPIEELEKMKDNIQYATIYNEIFQIVSPLEVNCNKFVESDKYVINLDNVNLYTNFAWYKDTNLSIVEDCCFASTAWGKGEKAFKKVLGEKFSHITLDNMESYASSKYNFKRITNIEEFNKKLATYKHIIAVGKPYIKEV